MRNQMRWKCNEEWPTVIDSGGGESLQRKSGVKCKCRHIYSLNWGQYVMILRTLPHIFNQVNTIIDPLFVPVQVSS